MSTLLISTITQRSHRLCKWLSQDSVWSRMVSSSSLNMQHGPSCLSVIAVVSTPTALSVTARFSGLLQLSGRQHTPLDFPVEGVEQFRPDGFQDYSDERLRASHCWLCLCCWQSSALRGQACCQF